MKPSGKQMLLPLQFFRACAALLVVLVHVTQASQGKFGYTYLRGIFQLGGSGVDFFFVLSGFIICYVHFRDVGIKGAVKAFIVRRLVRIYPIYWLVLIPISATYFLVPSFGKGFEREIPVIIKSFLLWPQRSTILGVAWTLSYEMLFYAVFALVIWKPRWFTPLAGIWLLVVLARTVGLFEPLGQVSGLADFLLSDLMLEFAIGCLAAYLVQRIKVPYAGGILSLGLFAFVGAWALQINGLPIHRLIAWGFPSGLIALGAAGVIFAVDQPLLRVGAWLGDASYSIYLSHQVVLSAIVKVVHGLGIQRVTGPFVAVSCSLLATVLVGCMLHAYVEKPLLSRLRRAVSPARTVSAPR